jgi:multiple sugar transport system ATP-binding protein
MVFQNYALYPHMNVRQNMGFALKQRRVSRTEIEARVQNAARILGLESLLDRKPRALSGGQRQRVAMGRAIVRDPNVFLFDEPLSNLDAKLRGEMRSELKELHQRLQTTTVYVTHDQEGPPLELYDRPQSLFVAAFIGSPPMNFLEGFVASGALVLDNGEQLKLPIALPAGERIVAGVRPEHFVISAEGWPAVVSVVEPTGSETQITARIAGHVVRVLIRGRTDVKPGETIHLSAASSHLHVFDPGSGKRREIGD